MDNRSFGEAVLPPIDYRGRALRTSKAFRAGTHRARTPAETFELIRPYLPQAGVTRIADVTGLDNVGVPTVLAIRPNSETIACSSGKGVTLDQAYVSGAMEAFELHAAESARLPAVRRSYRELTDDFDMPEVEDLPLSLHSIFSVDWPFHWYFGWDLIRRIEAPVPLATIGMSRNSALIESMGAFHVTSNGLGAGNSLLEAIASGLYEAIERDAFACNYLASLRTGRPIPLLDERMLRRYPMVEGVLDKCDRARVAIMVQDCTVDTDVPTYNAIAYDLVDQGVGVVHGTGSHLDPEVAILRAITEALQARLNFIAGSRDDMFRSAFRRWRGDWRHLSEVLTRERAESPVAMPRVSTAADTFEADVGQLLDKLQAVGLRSVIVADLTPPGFPVHVVRVLAPGLEGYMHRGYRPARRAERFATNASAA